MDSTKTKNELLDAKVPEVVRKINLHKQATQRGYFNKEEALGVLQREIGIVTAESQMPIVGSKGANPCILIAIYNRASRTAD